LLLRRHIKPDVLLDNFTLVKSVVLLVSVDIEDLRSAMRKLAHMGESALSLRKVGAFESEGDCTLIHSFFEHSVNSFESFQSTRHANFDLVGENIYRLRFPITADLLRIDAISMCNDHLPLVCDFNVADAQNLKLV